MYVFVSLVEPSLDLDILPFWIEHYHRAKLDRYIIRIHRRPGVNDEQVLEAIRLFELYGWEWELVEGLFNNGALQKHVIDAIRDTLSPRDIVVAADSDEFHACTDYRSMFSYAFGEKGIEVAIGSFVDRWDSTIHRAVPRIPLDHQYPLKGDIYEAVREYCGGAETDGNWQAPINKTKVLAFRNSAPVCCQGFHDAPQLQDLNREIGHTVYHYSWRSGFVGRMLGKSYHTPWFIGGLLAMFGVGPEDRERRKFEEWAEARQRERGWVASTPLGMTPSLDLTNTEERVPA